MHLFLIWFTENMWGGITWHYFYLHESSSWVEIRLHAENPLTGYPGSGLKVWLGRVVGGSQTNNLVTINKRRKNLIQEIPAI